MAAAIPDPLPLFVYGSLRSPDLMAAVAGEVPPTPREALLTDYRVTRLEGNVVPTITPTPGRTAEGLLFEGFSREALRRLDLYEVGFGYTPIEITVQVDGTERAAVMYDPPNDQQASDDPWSLEAWEVDHLQAALLTVDEIFRGGLPDPETLNRNWHMVEHRAWARIRAAERQAPARVRMMPSADAIHVETDGPALGEFFRLQAIDIRHRRFDGSITDVLRREVFLAAEAALVLPYDPQTDRVLLVEQVRMGPAILGDPNPWTLEPVAGMVDARETPEEAARRETLEEAGLTLDKLVHIASFYPSPGSATDYFHTYLGLCDLDEMGPASGGLDSENEDLKLHRLSFDAAMDLARSGEITAGPLLTMLYWLLAERPRLRAV